MMTLKTYRDEWANYPSMFKRETPNARVTKMMTEKLRRHFKIPSSAYCNNVDLNKRTRGSANLQHMHIRLPQTCTLGMIAHEVAHLLGHHKYGSTGHDRQFRRAMKIVVNYCKRKNYWDNQIDWKFRQKGNGNYYWHVGPLLEKVGM